MELDLEIKKAVDEIKSSKARTVCLQLPDGLKPRAAEIQEQLKKKTRADIIIWAGSCFGACDTPHGLDKLGVDLLIQWGHSEFKK